MGSHWVSPAGVAASIITGGMEVAALSIDNADSQKKIDRIIFEHQPLSKNERETGKFLSENNYSGICTRFSRSLTVPFSSAGSMAGVQERIPRFLVNMAAGLRFYEVRVRVRLARSFFTCSS
jgi:hypothetical protein